MVDGKDISLVLGSGGARGLAHIGVIRWLEEHNYRIQSIAGCSMGALIGGIHAAGRLGDYEQWVRGINKMGIFSLLDFSLGKGGLVKGEKLITVLQEMVGETLIEDLPVSFTAVAADIAREREVWINKGPLFDAVRASISMPLFFTPVKLNGVTLIDGSIFNPVPIAPTFHDLTDLTVAVNTIGVAEPVAEETKENAPPSFRNRVEGFWDNLKNGWTEDDDEEEWTMSYIVSQSLDAMQGVIARQKLAAHPPDVLVEIPRNACGTMEFDRAAEMIALGYQKAQECFARLVS